MPFFWENPLVANPRMKRWVTDVLEHRDALARALRMPLGEMLGCGHWGCVFDSKGPWVVKLTIDPNEAPVWQRIVQLVDQEEWGQGGIVRVKGVYRLDPGIPYGGRNRTVYAIVREAVEPVFKGQDLELTSTTKRHLLLGQKRKVHLVNGMRLNVDPKTKRSFYRVEHFLRTINGLYRYRFAVSGARSIEGLQRYVPGALNQISDHIGETLSMFAQNGLYLRDVHMLNIGWRKHSTISGFGYEDKTMVIFDPGHTPIGRDTTIPTVRRT